jgi:hypothetical protein
MNNPVVTWSRDHASVRVTDMSIRGARRAKYTFAGNGVPKRGLGTRK